MTPITRQAGKTLGAEAQGMGDLFIGGEFRGICLSSEWPVQGRTPIRILGQRAKAGAKQHACFITRWREKPQ